MGDGQRDELDVERGRLERGQSQADAVDGDRPLGNKIRPEVSGEGDGQTAAGRLFDDPEDSPQGIDMPADQMAAERRRECQRQFQVHLFLVLERAEVRPGQGFLGEVEKECIRLAPEETQADPFDGHAFSLLQGWKGRGNLDRQFLHPGAVAFVDTEVSNDSRKHQRYPSMMMSSPTVKVETRWTGQRSRTRRTSS